MTQTIQLFNIFGSDLFSRARADVLCSIIDNEAVSVTFDFSEISFMSRSFTDEVFNIIDSNKDKSFEFINCNDIVKSMLRIVANGREHERSLGIPHPMMYKFENQTNLADFLVSQ